MKKSTKFQLISLAKVPSYSLTENRLNHIDTEVLFIILKV